MELVLVSHFHAVIRSAQHLPAVSLCEHERDSPRRQHPGLPHRAAGAPEVRGQVRWEEFERWKLVNSLDMQYDSSAIT